MQRLQLVLKKETGAMQRVLMTASRRAFEPVGVIARRRGGKFVMILDVEGKRPVRVLARFLAKLFDVEQVKIVGRKRAGHRAAESPVAGNESSPLACRQS
ncbi:MAG: hypothetical protein KatS3mg105_2938 [Gemmatales bacterium]|nr:MAG: hypothetical protein KatS3mg105_2938 [Gemmatales bacterium]